MKTPNTEGPDNLNQHRSKPAEPARPKRTTETGPLGFSTVMRDIEEHGTERRKRLPGSKQSQRGALRDGTKRHGKEGGDDKPSQQPPTSGQSNSSHSATTSPSPAPTQSATSATTTPDSAAASHPHTTVTDALAKGAVLSGTQTEVAQTQTPVTAVQHQRAVDAAPAGARDLGSAQPKQLGQMTPQSALRAVVKETLLMELEHASKEVHIELEPEHLGPLIVEIKRDGKGGLTVRMRARQADAARILDAGADLLRDSLAEAGFAGAVVGVEHDPEA